MPKYKGLDDESRRYARYLAEVERVERVEAMEPKAAKRMLRSVVVTMRDGQW